MMDEKRFSYHCQHKVVGIGSVTQQWRSGTFDLLLNSHRCKCELTLDVKPNHACSTYKLSHNIKAVKKFSKRMLIDLNDGLTINLQYVQKPEEDILIQQLNDIKSGKIMGPVTSSLSSKESDSIAGLKSLATSTPRQDHKTSADHNGSVFSPQFTVMKDLGKSQRKDKSSIDGDDDDFENDISMEPSAKRPRKPNFSDKEVTTLLEEILVEHAMLFSSHSPSVTQQKNNAIWARITETVNACGVATRTSQECKDKWRTLKGAVVNKQRETRKTGGGPAPQRVPHEDVILTILGEQSTLITGIPVDSADTHEDALHQQESCQTSTPSCVNLDQPLGCSQWSSCGNAMQRPTPCPPDAVYLIDQLSADCGSFAQVEAHQRDDDIPVSVTVTSTAEVTLQSVGEASSAAKPIKARLKCKNKKAAAQLFGINEDDLVNDYFKSEIDKNKAIQTLAYKYTDHLELKNRKIMLEIAHLEDQNKRREKCNTAGLSE